MQQYRNSGFNFLPPIVKNLLIINGLFFLIDYVLEKRFNIELSHYLGLFPFQSPNFRFYQIITHIFMHADLTHLLSNMFALYMFGSVIENYWGPKRFVIYYLFTGLGAAILHQSVNYIEIYTLQSQISTYTINPSLENFNKISIPDWIKDQAAYNAIREEVLHGIYSSAAISHMFDLMLSAKMDPLYPAVGASGAIFGILLAYGMMFPNSLIYLYFAIPIKAKWFVIGYGAMELYLGIANNPKDNIAHFAHLGGMLFGYILIKYWNKNVRNRFY